MNVGDSICGQELFGFSTLMRFQTSRAFIYKADYFQISCLHHLVYTLSKYKGNFSLEKSPHRSA